MIGRIRRYLWIARGVGLDNVPRRLLQAYRLRTGWLRRRLDPARFTDEAFRAATGLSAAGQPDAWRRRAERFLPLPSREALEATAGEPRWQADVEQTCERIVAGEYFYFSHWYGRLGWPPDFNRDPVHEVRWPTNRHWLDTLRSPPDADIKFVWEPSRFTTAFHFARAYRRTGEPRWAEAFWSMFDAWVEQNPPQMTVAWACGQETVFRLMAMLFAACHTLDSDAATGERLYRLTRLAWQSARRIEPNINYARSQKNNHALSEALGLWTVGLLFPEFSRAAVWRRRGLGILNAEVRRQVYDDGSYVQHSHNYHRVMLDDLLWVIALARVNREPLPPAMTDRFARATAWLAEMVDPVSGRVPNYGSNDGANVLPLSCGDYRDYRPTLQACGFAATQQRWIEAQGPWDEKLLWLGGAEATEAPARREPRRSSFVAPDGGYLVTRGPGSWAMTRATTYRDRPSQADMLHLDLWAGGVNVLRDAGSFQYKAPEPWQHYFHATAAHNTVEVDGVDQMIKGPRFLWFRWPRGRVRAVEAAPETEAFRLTAEHDGYTRLPDRPVHQRRLVREGDVYRIHDRIRGQGEHDVALRWRLAPGEWVATEAGRCWAGTVADQPWSIRIDAPDRFEARLVSGQADPPEGWESPYYGEKTPCPTLIVTARTELPVELVTTIGPQRLVDGESGREQRDG